MSSSPDPITEAAGLLRSGLIFPRRVGLQRVDEPGSDADILLGFKRGGFSVYIGDAPLLHFDRDGRWQRAFITGIHYLKGLDTQVQAVDRVREGESMVLRRRVLGKNEATALDAAIAAQIQTLRDDLIAGRFNLIPPPAPSATVSRADLDAIFARITAWDAAAWTDHQARYRLAYGTGPAPFLPPDCPNPVILRADSTTTVADFATHARAVARLLGQRLNGCRDVFLTGPGWLDRPEAEVLGLLAAINAVFPIQPAQGRPRALDAGADAPRLETIHGWLDDPPRDRPLVADLIRFRDAHIGRITLRVDVSALPDFESVWDLIADLKTAGLGVGLACFVSESTPPLPPDLLARLPLTKGDLIALIPDSEAGGGDDSAFLADLKTRVQAAVPTGPRVVVYNPAKQWI